MTDIVMNWRVYRKELYRNGNSAEQSLMGFPNEIQATAIAGMLNLTASLEVVSPLVDLVTYSVYPFQEARVQARARLDKEGK